MGEEESLKMQDTPFQHIFLNCIEERRKRILVIYDSSTEHFMNQLCIAGRNAGKQIECIRIAESNRHGVEPPKEIADKMLKSELVMCLTRGSLAHTKARNCITEKGIPFLSMPDYSQSMLSNPAHYVNYEKVYPVVKRYADILSNGSVVKIVTEKGTDLYLDIFARFGSCCPGVVNNDYLLGSPPDIEANIAPIEDRTNGIMVVDGSITDERIGLLEEPITLAIVDGRIVEISSSDKICENHVKQIFREVCSEQAYYVGELGIGFNDKAQICGNMLVDEGTKGCIHFGMGSNWTIGGTNKVAFHLDFVMRDATVFVDDNKIIEKGVLLYE